MTITRDKKRKVRNSSDNESNNRKVCKQRGPSGKSVNASVSEVLQRTNSVLYGEDNLESSVFEQFCDSAAMAENNAEPTIRDLMTLMKNVSDRLESVEKKMGGIDSIENKMCNTEKDLNKLWVALEDRVRKVDERVTRIEDKVDGADIHAAQLSERVQELEKQRDTLRDNVTYLQSQSMRNNLIFTGVSEDNSNGSEQGNNREEASPAPP